MCIISSGSIRAAYSLIEGPKMRPQAGQIDKAVDLAKQVVVGDMPLNAEAVEQRLLHHQPLAHYPLNSP